MTETEKQRAEILHMVLSALESSGAGSEELRATREALTHALKALQAATLREAGILVTTALEQMR